MVAGYETRQSDTLTTARRVNIGSYRFVRLGDTDFNGLKIRCPRAALITRALCDYQDSVFRVANLWTEFPARDVYGTVADGKECKNPK
jgi:hypothetical protein